MSILRPDAWGDDAREIVERYRAQGKSGKDLRVAVARHARLLRPLDLGAAENLEDFPLDQAVADA